MDIASLREKIRRIEGVHAVLGAEGRKRPAGWRFGVPDMDQALPGGALSLDALHDFTPDRAVNMPAVSSLIHFLLPRLPRRGPIVWCRMTHDNTEYGRPYGPGLLASGLDPARLVFVSLNKAASMAFALEEALKMPALAAVIGEGTPLGFTESRRLSLIAQKSRVPCLFVNTKESGEASAAVTRWRAGPVPGPSGPYDDRLPGKPAWSLELTRSRGGKAGSWKVFWDDDTHSFAPLPASGARTLHGRRLQGAVAPDRAASRIAG